MDMTFKLQVFEGPLDLLLYLIEKNKVNIYDIPIVEITAQYMEYVNQMKKDNLDTLSEFLVMAAILPLQIHKSFTIYHRKLLIIFNAALSLINHIYKLRYELLLTRHYSLKHNSIPALWQIVR